LKELVELKFPKLARHLDMCDIDLTTVTLNWFLALFFDAVPFMEVLKELVELKFPKLARHLDMCDIDLTTVTLNWFLALFFDAVPFMVEPVVRGAVEPHDSYVGEAV
uniref:Rab-GAP TBC domain-containing protein n=1 Tax=Steinernema glaseri TaxID=37863 RepID=A0A1I8ARL1_9BILA